MVIEKMKSRERSRGEQATGTLEYAVLTSHQDDMLAEVEFLGAIPGSFAGLPLQSYSLTPVASIGAGGFLYDGTATYGKPDAEEPDVPVITFDTGGGTQHIQVAISTAGAYALPGRTAPDYGNAIGVTKDSIDGVDIVVPNFSWSEERKFHVSTVTNAFIQNLENATGKTNDAPFRGRAAGEVLFLGANGTKSDALTWPITFKFASSRNVTGVTIGGISGIAKGGWEYLWVSYEDFKDETATPPKLVKRPVSVHVQQVYASFNFGNLGIGS